MLAQNVYRTRRELVLEQLPAEAVMIIRGGSLKHRNADAHYRFRQDSNFYYLTGFNEPEAVLVLIRGVGSILFCAPKDAAIERWDGCRLGPEAACEQLDMHKAYPLDALDTHMCELIANRAAVYYPFGHDAWLDARVQRWLQSCRHQVRKGLHAPAMLSDARTILHEMRLIKSDDEISLMRDNCQRSAQAHIRAMRAGKDAKFEYELEAELLHEFYRYGCRAPAYDSIVASGNNACTLHYTNNNAALKDGDLILIDAGGEYDGYAADITRTFPKSGKFSNEQAELYNLVLKAQAAAIAKAQVGERWNAMQEAILAVLSEGLMQLKIINTPDETKNFYMHNSGHWLGLDVHDVGEYKQQAGLGNILARKLLRNTGNKNTAAIWRKLVPGMVLTIEPGLYIPQGCNAPKQWQGIGIRIEDDVLITRNGPEVFSQDAPKTIEAIEALA